MRVVQMVCLDTIRGPPISATAKQVESGAGRLDRNPLVRVRGSASQRPNTTTSSSADAQRGIPRPAFPSDGASHCHIRFSDHGSFPWPKGAKRQEGSSTRPSHAQHDAAASDATALGMGDVTLRPR